MAELLFDSRADASSDDASPADKARATVYLSHLKGYKRMGTAWVECVAGCECERSVLDGTWAQQATLMQIHSFKVGGAGVLGGAATSGLQQMGSALLVGSAWWTAAGASSHLGSPGGNAAVGPAAAAGIGFLAACITVLPVHSTCACSFQQLPRPASAHQL